VPIFTQWTIPKYNDFETADDLSMCEAPMIFQTFGAFPIDLDSYGNIPGDLCEFWSQVEQETAGLSSAKGCYVFGIKTSGGPSVFPWYMGKTLRSFDVECFQYHKRVLYAKAISFYKRATPCIFFIPRMTNGGLFYSGSGAIATNFLDRHLISLGLQVNPDLLNKKDTKLYREVQLRGILNSEGTRPDQAAKALRLALRL
jgi:hypothetical protein